MPVLIEQVRLATLALTQAAAAIPDDRMLVPDQPANSLGHLLADVCGRRTAGRSARAWQPDPGKETND